MDIQYVYRPLTDEAGSSIGLLYIIPGAEDEPVHVRVEEVHLEENWNNVECYVALSYTWDSPGTENRIYVGEDGEEGYMLVRRNVDAALRRLRSSGNEDYQVVWIDAICINQQDDLEKMRQVAMMGSIYSKSMGTVVWLGEADERTGPGLEACEVLAAAWRKMEAGEEMEVDEAASIDESWETESANSMDFVGMKATKTVRAVILGTRGQGPSKKAKSKKRKRKVSQEGSVSLKEALDRGNGSDDHPLVYIYPEQPTSLKDRLLSLLESLVALRDAVASDRQLLELRKLLDEEIHYPAHLVVDALAQHLKVVLEKGHDELLDDEEYANMDFGVPFGPALSLDAALSIGNTPSASQGSSIGDVSYTAILRLSLLLALTSGWCMSDDFHRLDYLDLAAEDTVIRAMPSVKRQDTRKGHSDISLRGEEPHNLGCVSSNDN
jgi:hypothetical protein